jgi:potassium-transporting ATPase ATP-binding subunit
MRQLRGMVKGGQPRNLGDVGLCPISLPLFAEKTERERTNMTTDQIQIQEPELETKAWKTRRKGEISIFDPKIIRRAIPDSLKKLDPRVQLKNPVMFVVEVGSVITSIEFLRLLFAQPNTTIDRTHLTYEIVFVLAVAIWLWFTVIFANFAEAMAEGRGKAQADTLRKARSTTMARRLAEHNRASAIEEVTAPELRKGDFVLVEAGEVIPGDGEVIEGVASVDESAITGESAPVIRESGGDRSAVTGGTRVLSDWIVVQISANPGETFLDRMIALVEGAKRQKTPNEIALNILIASLMIIFVLVVVTLEPFAIYSGQAVSVTTLIALLVCLIPTTIGGLLSAIGIAGMDRMVQRNVLAGPFPMDLRRRSCQCVGPEPGAGRVEVNQARLALGSSKGMNITRRPALCVMLSVVFSKQCYSAGAAAWPDASELLLERNGESAHPLWFC